MGLSGKEIKKKTTASVQVADNGQTGKNPTRRKNPPAESNGTALSSRQRSNSTRRPSIEQEDSSLLNDKELLRILLQVRNGNFAVRMPIGEVGVKGRVFDTLNEIISLNEQMMLEFTKAGNTIGKQGKLTQRIEVPNAKGFLGHGCRLVECFNLRPRTSHH